MTNKKKTEGVIGKLKLKLKLKHIGKCSLIILEKCKQWMKGESAGEVNEERESIYPLCQPLSVSSTNSRERE